MKRSSIVMMAVAVIILPYFNSYSQNTSGERKLERVYTALAQAELSKEDEEKYLKKFSAEAKAKLEEIKKLNKNKYIQLLRGSGYFFMGDYSSGVNLYDLARSNYNTQKDSQSNIYQKQHEAEINVQLLVLKYQKADAGSQQKLRSELYNALGKLFDIRESYKQDEIKNLEKRLQELTESLNARKQSKDNIITRRLKELLNEKDELRW